MPVLPVHLAVLLLAGSLACTSLPDTTASTDSPFAGTWTQREVVAGNSFTLTLAVEGTSVKVTGNFPAAESRTGTLTGKGTIGGPRVQVEISYDNGKVAQFDLELTNPSVLTGTLHFGDARMLTPSAIVTFDKKK